MKDGEPPTLPGDGSGECGSSGSPNFLPREKGAGSKKGLWDEGGDRANWCPGSWDAGGTGQPGEK